MNYRSFGPSFVFYFWFGFFLTLWSTHFMCCHSFVWCLITRRLSKKRWYERFFTHQINHTFNRSTHFLCAMKPNQSEPNRMKKKNTPENRTSSRPLSEMHLIFWYSFPNLSLKSVWICLTTEATFSSIRSSTNKVTPILIRFRFHAIYFHLTHWIILLCFLRLYIIAYCSTKSVKRRHLASVWIATKKNTV